jgi:hypothetical protein
MDRRSVVGQAIGSRGLLFESRKTEPQTTKTDRPGHILLRGLRFGIIVLSTAINYLDRQLRAAFAPALKNEFRLNNAIYALMARPAGTFIEQSRLNAGASAAVMVWSFASVATWITRAFAGLLGRRTLLGIAGATGIPSSRKANATYLRPAPLIAAVMAARFGWQFTFVVSGVLGLAWVPLVCVALSFTPLVGVGMPLADLAP